MDSRIDIFKNDMTIFLKKYKHKTTVTRLLQGKIGSYPYYLATQVQSNTETGLRKKEGLETVHLYIKRSPRSKPLYLASLSELPDGNLEFHCEKLINFLIKRS